MSRKLYVAKYPAAKIPSSEICIQIRLGYLFTQQLAGMQAT